MPRQKEFERKEALEKALNVFWQYGYNATSFQVLTEGMCISRQSIYDTYGDKHTLFIEALQYYTDKNTAMRQEFFSQDKPVKEILRSYLETLTYDIKTDAQQKGCFMTNSSLEMIPHDEEVKKIVSKNTTRVIKDFQQLIQRGIQSGELTTSRDPEMLATFIVNTINGLNSLGKTITDRKKMQMIVDITLSVLE